MFEWEREGGEMQGGAVKISNDVIVALYATVQKRQADDSLPFYYEIQLI